MATTISAEMDSDKFPSSVDIDGKVNTVMLLQRHLFIKQTEAYNDAMTTLQVAMGEHATSLPAFLSGNFDTPEYLPEILSRRNISDECRAQQRLLDNEELTLLAIVSAEGSITSPEKLQDFMILMTHITKVVIHLL